MSFPFWTTVYHYTFARGYIRVPILLAIPIIYNKYVNHAWEPMFQSWNRGRNQQDVWNRLAAKVAAEDAE